MGPSVISAPPLPTTPYPPSSYKHATWMAKIELRLDKASIPVVGCPSSSFSHFNPLRRKRARCRFDL